MAPVAFAHGEGGVDDRPPEPLRERQPCRSPQTYAAVEQVARPVVSPGLDLRRWARVTSSPPRRGHGARRRRG